MATDVHLNQKRKGKNDPYVIHPLSVGLILSRVGASEDTIVAGILHDTIEDCEPYGSVTKEMIEEEFGGDVARMVNDVTEQDKSLPWDERKKQALLHMKEMKEDSLIVKSADVLQNLSDLVNDYEKEGDVAFKKFSAPKNAVLTRFQNLEKELTRLYPQNPLLPEIKAGIQKIT